MSEVGQLSDADLIAAFQAAQQNQNAAAMTHSGTGGFDPASNAWMDMYGPLSGMSTPEKLAAGVGRGMVHTGRAVGNLVGLVPDSTMTEERKLDAPLLASGPGQFGNMVGESAITAPLGMGTAAAVGNLGKAGAALAASPVANAAIQGGVQGLATSDPGERGFNSTIGAMTGGGLGVNQAIMSKLVNGLKRTPAAQTLLDRGVQLTPGQMNPGGVMNQFEQALEGVPGAKQIVHGARENAEQQYQAAVIQQGAAPGATIKPSENIHDMLQQAYDSYAPLYDQAKGFPVKAAVMNGRQGVKLSALFDQASATPGTTDAGQKAAKSFLDNELTRLPQNPTSTDLLTLRSNIRQAARIAKLSTDTIAGDKAAIYSAADDHVTHALNSQLPPDALAALQSADSKYGTYKTVENAVAAAKDNIAGLTPQKLSQAVFNQTADPAYARGAGGPLRDLSDAGTHVFQTVVQPNGARVATLGAAALAAAKAPHIAIPAAAGMLGLTGSETGRALAAGATAPQRQAQKLIEALRTNVPEPLRNVGGQLALRGGTAAGMPVTQAALPQALAAALMLAPPAAQSQAH